MARRGSPGADIEGCTRVIAEQGGAARGGGSGEPVSGESNPAAPDFGDDLDAPDTRNVIIYFSPSLVLERLDALNWGLKQRVVVTGEGKHARKHKWVLLGYYGTPGKCAGRVAALLLVEGVGLTASAVEAAHVYREVERGLVEDLVRAERADAVEKARAGIAASAREEALREAAQLVTDSAVRREVLALSKKKN